MLDEKIKKKTTHRGKKSEKCTTENELCKDGLLTITENGHCRWLSIVATTACGQCFICIVIGCYWCHCDFFIFLFHLILFSLVYIYFFILFYSIFFSIKFNVKVSVLIWPSFSLSVIICLSLIYSLFKKNESDQHRMNTE